MLLQITKKYSLHGRSKLFIFLATHKILKINQDVHSIVLTSIIHRLNAHFIRYGTNIITMILRYKVQDRSTVRYCIIST